MSVPAYIQKTLRMKPEVEKIFNDLDQYLDYCRFNLTKYDPADLYKSRTWKDFQRASGIVFERKPYLGKKPRQDRTHGEHFSN